MAIRDFIRTLPEGERIQVHAIDIHLSDYGDTESWLSYLDYITQNVLPNPGPIAAFLQGDHDTYESHRVLLETLQAQLEDGRSELTASWGDYWYSTVVEMIEVELRGVAVRAIRESDYDESVSGQTRSSFCRWTTRYLAMGEYLLTPREKSM